MKALGPLSASTRSAMTERQITATSNSAVALPAGLALSAGLALPARLALTVVIPCFNERHSVLAVLERVKRLPLDKLVIVVDNCSTDGTRELLRSVCSSSAPALLDRARLERLSPGCEVLFGEGVAVVLQPRNRRKGASVRLGLALAQSDYFVCQDADFEYDPDDLVRLLEHARSTGAVAVFGSRLSAEALALSPRVIPRDAFQLGRVVLTGLFQLLYRSRITDVATCYKLLKTDVAQSLELRTEGFDLDFEIPARLRLQGHTIVEVPVHFTPRNHAQGKKIRWQDGLGAAAVLLELWASSPYHRLQSAARVLTLVPRSLAKAGLELVRQGWI
jgi:glycosyltransferase involved in cell wall biosynthesis